MMKSLLKFPADCSKKKYRLNSEISGRIGYLVWNRMKSKDVRERNEKLQN